MTERSEFSMSDAGELNKETFMGMAEAAGLDVSDEAHMEELYAYVQGVLPGLKAIHGLDLAEVEPAAIFVPPVQ